MPPVAVSPALSVTSEPLARLEADVLVVPAFEGEEPAATLPELDAATGGEIRAAQNGEFRGRPYELFFTPATATGWRVRRIALAGAGRAADMDTERMRRLATAAAFAARQRGSARVAFLVRGLPPGPAAVQAVAEGLLLAAFSGDFYKTGERLGPPPQALCIVVPTDARGVTQDLERAADRGRILGDACNLARTLCNEPSNILTPTAFAERGAAFAREAGVTVYILDEREIARLRMGLLLGVARGST